MNARLGPTRAQASKRQSRAPSAVLQFRRCRRRRTLDRVVKRQGQGCGRESQRSAAPRKQRERASEQARGFSIPYSVGMDLKIARAPPPPLHWNGRETGPGHPALLHVPQGAAGDAAAPLPTTTTKSTPPLAAPTAPLAPELLRAVRRRTECRVFQKCCRTCRGAFHGRTLGPARAR